MLSNPASFVSLWVWFVSQIIHVMIRITIHAKWSSTLIYGGWPHNKLLIKLCIAYREHEFMCNVDTSPTIELHQWCEFLEIPILLGQKLFTLFVSIHTKGSYAFSRSRIFSPQMHNTRDDLLVDRSKIGLSSTTIWYRLRVCHGLQQCVSYMST